MRVSSIFYTHYDIPTADIHKRNYIDILDCRDAVLIKTENI